MIEKTTEKYNTYRIIPDYDVTNKNNEVLVNVFSSLYSTPKQRVNFKDLSYSLPKQIYFVLIL